MTLSQQQEFQALLSHARVLSSGPLTFRKNLEGWNAVLGPDIPKCAALGAPHGRAHGIDDDDFFEGAHDDTPIAAEKAE